ncbi:MAG: zinc-ribbon domain-containing protein [Verrucomicrobiota bacterium JB025]
MRFSGDCGSADLHGLWGDGGTSVSVRNLNRQDAKSAKVFMVLGLVWGTHTKPLKCPKCGAAVTAGALSCMGCGATVAPQYPFEI